MCRVDCLPANLFEISFSAPENVRICRCPVLSPCRCAEKVAIQRNAIAPVTVCMLTFAAPRHLSVLLCTAAYDLLLLLFLFLPSPLRCSSLCEYGVSLHPPRSSIAADGVDVARWIAGRSAVLLAASARHSNGRRCSLTRPEWGGTFSHSRARCNSI